MILSTLLQAQFETANTQVAEHLATIESQQKTIADRDEELDDKIDEVRYLEM